MEHAYNPQTQEVKTRESGDEGQPDIYNEFTISPHYLARSHKLKKKRKNFYKSDIVQHVERV